ncbi:MAG: CbiX/SirB N-terminal domain-containing protein [Candidatus Dactylopiibacterium sp.]|nr:CbiX/SirB N-terminal domain-containing protein [Candidatus Dactylopiibacterium sp.]
MPALILFGHGARDAAWAAPLQRLAEAVRRDAPGADVRLAFLEFMAPGLAEAIDAAVAGGAREIQVVPVFLAQGGHVRRDVPALIDAARARHGGVSIVLQDALGEHPAVLDAMARSLLERAGAR